jgi:uncharacterized membrane protein YfcA
VTTVVVLALGLAIGLTLGALGGGGSILTVPALVYVVGQDPKAATTSSLFIVGISSLVGAVTHARSGHVRWGVGLAFGATGVAASFAGTALNRMVDPDVLLLGFAALVLMAAAAMLAKARTPSPVPAGAGDPPAVEPAVRWTAPARIAKVVVAGLAVGFLTGFFGVGGGFVIVPALTLGLGLAMPEAVGTSLLVIALNSAAALLARAGSAHFDWAVIAPFTVAAIAGSLAGKKVADRLRADTLTRAFAVLLIAVAAWTATASIVALSG